MAAQPDPVPGRFHRDGVVPELAAHDVAQPSQAGVEEVAFSSLAGETGAAVEAEPEADGRMGHGEALDDLARLAVFGAFGLQEFEPRGGGVEEIGDLHRGAARARRGRRRRHASGLDADLRPGLGAGGAGDDPQPRHRADRRQSLASEAQRRDGGEIVVGELGGGVALHRQSEVGGGHAAAIVADGDERATAVLDRDLDPPGAGVDRVLDQLLDHRGRAFDHLARGDAVDGGLRQSPYRAHDTAHGMAGRLHSPILPAATPSGRPVTTTSMAPGSSSRAATRRTSVAVTASMKPLRRSR